MRKTRHKAGGKEPFDLFHGLHAAEMAQLRSRFIEQRVAAGEKFIAEGASGDCLFIVREGIVEVRRAGQSLGRHLAGDVVGEMALLNREPRNADVIALTDCVLERLPAVVFEKLCQELPQLKLVLTRLVAHRLNWSTKDVLTHKIGHYSVIGLLGEGGMGWVFHGVSSDAAPCGPGTEVALKMLPHPLVQRPRFLDRFRQEARLLERLRHENIIALHETIEQFGTLFLALEYVDGENVQQWIQRAGRPSVDEIRCVVRAIVCGLVVAHQQGIVHRDVKPQNVMIRTDGVVKLTDFGIAAPCGAMDTPSALGLTPAYAAPEMFTATETGKAGDFYSLGVLAYELMAGQLPYVGHDLEDWGRVHRTAVAPPLPARSAEQIGDLEGFIHAALTKDPETRLLAIQPWLLRWDQEPPPRIVPRAVSAPTTAQRCEPEVPTIVSD